MGIIQAKFAVVRVDSSHLECFLIISISACPCEAMQRRVGSPGYAPPEVVTDLPYEARA